MDGVTVEREIRGGTAYWVHLTGSLPFTSDLEGKLNAKLSAEARKWAKELGMTTSGMVSGGGEYGTRWRHSGCFMFREEVVLCNCEHETHFPEKGGGHPHMAVVAGKRKAQHVGRVCDDCASTHMAEYLV